MTGRRGAHPLTPAVWAGTILLVVLGITAAWLRATHIGTMTARFDPVRGDLLTAMGLQDPLAAIRPGEVARVDESFARSPATTLLHVLTGAAFFALLPFQFSRRIRSGYVTFHRWSGRALLVVGTASAIAGLYFGLSRPYAGAPEGIVVAIFGSFFLVSALLAWRAIRRRDIDRHREWILRAVAVALGISTARLIGLPLDIWLTQLALHPRLIFFIDITLAWCLTVGFAEWWIRATRRGAAVA